MSIDSPFAPSPRRRGTPLAVALSLALAAAGCGGGGGGGGGGKAAACKTCQAQKIVGIAASGAPIAGGSLELLDASGARRTAIVAADGSYSLDVAGLPGPFLIEVAGLIGGHPAVIHSLALASDIGTHAVNVTPLTELLTAFVLGADPRDVFRSGAPDLSKVTAESLASAEALVAAKLKPVLAAYGVSDANVRTSEFSADGTGIDAALDAVNVTAVQDQATGAPQYQLVVVTQDGPQMLVPSELGSFTLSDVNTDLLTQMGTILPAVNAQLQAVSALFAHGTPAKGDLAPFFAPGFRHNGLGFDAFYAKVLATELFKGSRIGPAALEKITDASHVTISYTTTFTTPVRPRRDSVQMVLTDGKWLIQGNGQIAAMGVSYIARLVETPLTLEELRARTDLVWKTKGELGYVRDVTDPGYAVPCYSMDPTKAPAGDDAKSFVWSCQDYSGFGVELSGGDPDVYREQARRYTQYLAAPNSRIRPYLVFYVSTAEVDPDVDHVVVTGAGLPAGGLTLTWPLGNVPRDYFILQGDGKNFNAFASDLCLDLNPIPGGAACKLDWENVRSGTTYQFVFHRKSASEPVYAYPQLLGRPRDTTALFAERDRFIPQFDLPPEEQFTVANVLDLNGNFTSGGSVTVHWKIPPDPTVKMDSLWVWRAYYTKETYLYATEPHVVGLYGSTATSATITFDTVDALPTGAAWADLTAIDIYGNQLQHEVSGSNPF